MSPLYFFSYMFIPFSAIAFPHIGIFCLTAKRLSHFKHTAIAYPLCLMAIWLPSTILGVVANRATDVPAIERKLEARQMLATPGASLTPDQRQALRRQADGEDVVIQLLHFYAPVWLAGLLGAGIMAAVMSSDSQILALSTMFTEDVFAHYDGKRRYGEAAQVKLGRAFVILVTLVAYAVALWAPANIFSLATQYGFSGYAALSPMVFAALFWKRSTKWGALAVTLWAAGSVAATAVFQAAVAAPPPGQSLSVLSAGRMGPDLAHRHRHGGAGLCAGDADGPDLGGVDVGGVDRHAPAVGGDHRAVRRVETRNDHGTDDFTEGADAHSGPGHRGDVGAVVQPHPRARTTAFRSGSLAVATGQWVIGGC